MLDLATGALPDVAAHVDDEDLVGHRDLLEVDATESRALLLGELRGRFQRHRGQDHVPGERQLGLEALELLTETHRAAERDDGELIGR